jgi:hypothetical protein
VSHVAELPSLYHRTVPRNPDETVNPDFSHAACEKSGKLEILSTKSDVRQLLVFPKKFQRCLCRKLMRQAGLAAPATGKKEEYRMAPPAPHCPPSVITSSADTAGTNDQRGVLPSMASNFKRISVPPLTTVAYPPTRTMRPLHNT